MPAIGRRLEGLRAQVPVTTIVVIDTDADRQSVETPAAWTPIWVVRQGRSEDDATLLRQALDALRPPPGDGYIWIAAEGRVARTLRSYVLDDRGHAKAWVKAAGYWRRGEAAAHETFAE